MPPRLPLSTFAAACALSCTAPDPDTVEAALSRSTSPPGGLAVAQVPQ